MKKHNASKDTPYCPKTFEEKKKHPNLLSWRSCKKWPINFVQNLNFDWHIIREMQQEVSSKSCKVIFMGRRPEEDLEPELARKEEEGSG